MFNFILIFATKFVVFKQDKDQHTAITNTADYFY